MTRVPTVSVCIPTYNSATTIARCIDSVLAQIDVDFEVLIVDDDSTDDTVSIAASMLRPNDRLERNPLRLGLARNHNRCLDLASGEYVQFVHADDWLLTGALRTLTVALDESNGGMAWAPRHVVTDDAEWLRQYGAHYKKLKGLAARIDGPRMVMQVSRLGVPDNWIGEPTCVMFRRELALAAGGFRDDVYQLLDLDLWLRLMLRSSACFIPRELSVRSHTAATETVRNTALRRDWLDQLRVITSLVVDPAATPAIRVVNLLWWLPIWVRTVLGSVVLGPHRLSRLKMSLAAPMHEFARARRVFASDR